MCNGSRKTSVSNLPEDTSLEAVFMAYTEGIEEQA